MSEKKILFSELYFSGNEDSWKEYEQEYYDFVDVQLEKEIERIRSIDCIENFYSFLIDKLLKWSLISDFIYESNVKRLKEEYENDRNKLNVIFDKICEYVKKIENDSTEDYTYISNGINLLTEIVGVGPVCSTSFLAIILPSKFGVVSRHIIEPMKEVYSDVKEYKKVISKKQACELEIKLNEISRTINKRFDSNYWTPRKVDKVLWTIEMMNNKL
ncbi:DUF1759 domain-containing protein [Eubacterium sp.]|uniref:DUF1759 domain-containing protein n=1 Tax=Eubacterium sp. TaxID=142586 RepID=UPI0025F7803E|nr:DUF1759 domain-containing protein [Eubacterium sp.]MCR5629587.1 DUF1759 domain-containing protein [Eubacterium sp.]